MKNRKIIYTLISLAFATGFYVYDHFFDNKKVINSTIFIKNKSFLPTSTTGEIVHHKFYTLSYNERYEQAEWVAYTLTKQQVVYNNFKRPYFEVDKTVPTKSASYKDYKNSGYNKGHLCPAADRKFSKDAFNETFLMSNVSPQTHQFNSGIWNRLEKRVRYWAKKHKKLFIITGGILSSNLKTIGKDNVAVPAYFYKIILDYQNPKKLKAIAFLIPHKNSNKSLYKFVTSIDNLEQLTDIDFFEQLPDTIENKLEKNSSYFNWSFNNFN